MEDGRTFSFESDFLSLDWDPQDQILFHDFRGVLDAEQVDMYRAKLSEFQELFPELAPHDLVINVANIGKVTMAGRKAFAEIAKSPRPGRSVLYGMKAINKALLQFVMFASGRKDLVHVCNSREDAVEWLKKTRRGA